MSGARSNLVHRTQTMKILKRGRDFQSEREKHHPISDSCWHRQFCVEYWMHNKTRKHAPWKNCDVSSISVLAQISGFPWHYHLKRLIGSIDFNCAKCIFVTFFPDLPSIWIYVPLIFGVMCPMARFWRLATVSSRTMLKTLYLSLLNRTQFQDRIFRSKRMKNLNIDNWKWNNIHSRICGLRNLSENIYKQCFLCLWHRHPKLKIVYVRHQDNKRRKLRYLTNEYQWTHTMNVFRSISCYCCCDAQPSSIIGVLVLWQRLQKTKLIIVIYWMLEYPETRICTI